MNTRGRKKRTEQAYVLDAYKRLRGRGVPSLWEAPIMGRSADLAFLDGDKLITIEFKLSDWRKGLRQARDHQIAADFAFLCIPNREPSTELLAAAKEANIGLLRFMEGNDWPFETLHDAPRSHLTWSIKRNELLEKLKVPKK